MLKPNVNRERASTIVVEALTFGDAKAAERNKCSIRSIGYYKALARDDPAFAQLCREKLKIGRELWAQDAAAALRKMIPKLAELVESATVKELYQASGAVKIIGDLLITKGVLADDEQPGPDPEAPEDGRKPGGAKSAGVEDPEREDRVH